MPDPVNEPLPPAEDIPTIPDPAADDNESPGPATVVTKTSLLQRIRDRGAQIIQGRGIAFKKGRGRPRLDGQPSPTDTILGTEALDGNKTLVPSDPAAADSPATVSLCRRSAVAAVKTAKWFTKEMVRIKADAADIDGKFVEETLKKFSADPGAMEDFQQSLDAVLKKHNFKPTNDEEFALFIDACRLFGPDLLMLQAFNAEIKRRRHERELPPPKPPTQEEKK